MLNFDNQNKNKLLMDININSVNKSINEVNKKVSHIENKIGDRVINFMPLEISYPLQFDENN